VIPDLVPSRRAVRWYQVVAVLLAAAVLATTWYLWANDPSARRVKSTQDYPVRMAAVVTLDGQRGMGDSKPPPRT
jgi:lipopolysaccharide export system protein LptC